jgi:hypothetical protein
MIQTNFTQKSKLENNYILKHLTIIYKSSNNAKKLKINKNGMIQITYLNKVVYCEHHHYQYTYTKGTKNNFSMKNLNED